MAVHKEGRGPGCLAGGSAVVGSPMQLQHETTGPLAEGISPGREGGWQNGIVADVGSHQYYTVGFLGAAAAVELGC